MVLERSKINKPPHLEFEFENARLVEDELEEKNVPLTKAMAHEGEDYTKDKMEYLKLIKPMFEEISKDMTQNMVDMTQHIPKGFELMAIQMGSKGIIGDSGSSQSAKKKTMGEHILSRTGPHNRPHEFQSTPSPTTPKIFIPEEETNIQFEIDTITKEWSKLDEECRRSVTFEKYFTMENNLKNK